MVIVSIGISLVWSEKFILPNLVAEDSWPSEKKAKLDSVAPEIELPGLDGKIVKLSDYRGKIVMIAFWASWCPHCRTELHFLNRIHKKVRTQDLVMLTVNLDDTPQDIEYFMALRDYTFPVLFANEKTRELYQITSIPALFVIDRKGILKKKFSGFSVADEILLSDLINKLLQ